MRNERKAGFISLKPEKLETVRGYPVGTLVRLYTRNGDVFIGRLESEDSEKTVHMRPYIVQEPFFEDVYGKARPFNRLEEQISMKHYSDVIGTIQPISEEFLERLLNVGVRSEKVKLYGQHETI